METNNIIRLVTGYLSGSGIAVIIYPIFIFQYYRVSERIKIFEAYQCYIFFIIITVNAIIFQVLLLLLKPAFLQYFFIISTFLCNFYFLVFQPCFVSFNSTFQSKSRKAIWEKSYIAYTRVSCSFYCWSFYISYRLHIWVQRF